MTGSGMVEPAKLIVAVDFGTTFSGFAYAHMSESNGRNFMDNIEVYEQWPHQNLAGALPYCKTQTSLLYVQKDRSKPEYEVAGWGWQAFVTHAKRPSKKKPKDSQDEKFHFITKFKLGLAGPNSASYMSTVGLGLPEGLGVVRAISDYLHELSKCIMKELKNKHGEHISHEDVQWCLTVPAIWDETAKQHMKKCAEMAGLVAGPLNTHGGGSEHPIIIVLEPEAASVYCLHYLKKIHKTDLPAQSKVLIVDAGGGTVDLVLHEKVNEDSESNQVKEICSGSSGDLCGSSFVDEAFYDFLSKKISCFADFIAEDPSSILKIRTMWENTKICFDASDPFYDIGLLAKLADYWEEHDSANGIDRPDFSYDEVKISLDEMKSIFDPVVNRILDLIERQLIQVSSKIDAIMVVGGFSGNPYLMDSIKKRFSARVERIINPMHPGKAVVTGAVVYGGLGKEVIVSRIARKTYGIDICRDFRKGDPDSKLTYNDEGQPKCRDSFGVYIRRGDEVPVNHCQKRSYVPTNRSSDSETESITLDLYSTTDIDPSYVTDPGCTKQGSLSIVIPSKRTMKDIPKIEVSMFFGRSTLEVTAEALNFEGEKVALPAVTFETDGIR